MHSQISRIRAYCTYSRYGVQNKFAHSVDSMARRMLASEIELKRNNRFEPDIHEVWKTRTSETTNEKLAIKFANADFWSLLTVKFPSHFFGFLQPIQDHQQIFLRLEKIQNFSTFFHSSNPTYQPFTDMALLGLHDTKYGFIELLNK